MDFSSLTNSAEGMSVRREEGELGGEVGENLAPVLPLVHRGVVRPPAIADVARFRMCGVPFGTRALPLGGQRGSAVAASGSTDAVVALDAERRILYKRRVHEHDASAVDHEVGLEAVVVGRTAEMVDGRAHGTLMVIGVRDHSHELGTTQSRLESDDEAVGYLLAGVENPWGEHLLAHWHHHVRQHHLERERNHRLGFRLVVCLPVSTPPLHVLGVRLRREPCLDEKSLNVVLIDLLRHEFHRFVE